MMLSMYQNKLIGVDYSPCIRVNLGHILRAYVFLMNKKGR